MHSPYNIHLILSMVSVACLFAVQFVSFLEGRGLSPVSLDIARVCGAFLAGMTAGGLLFSPRFIRSRAAVPLAGVLTVAGAFLWDTAFNDGQGRALGACLVGGMLLPPQLNRLFNTSIQPGLHLGIALGLGDFFWLFLYIMPQPVTVETVKAVLLCLHAVGGLLAMLSLRQQRYEELSPANAAPHVVPVNPLIRESLFYLVAVALVFFLLNALIDISFYRMHSASFPIPAYVHLYIWAVYPLVGLYADRRRLDMKLLLICLGGSLLSPVSAAVAESTFLYWIIYLVGLGCRAAALMYFMLVFSRFRHKFSCPGLVVAVPYMAMFFSFWLVSLWVQRFPSTLAIVLLSLFLCAAFSYITSRVQYALTLLGLLGAAATRESSPEEAEQHCHSAALAFFSEKYGISAREQEILQLIVEGNDTGNMSEFLHISENTIKSHVRQLLRKTETRNRIALVSLFFHETRDMLDETSPPGWH